MAKNLIYISLILLFITACASKPTYEDSTKWYSDCNPHPGYHPGDILAFEPGIDEILCAEECADKYKCHNALPNESSRSENVKREKSCAESLYACKFECVEKEHPMAVHVEGGYYSDGSYYATCLNPFENIHPTKNKYEKTKWQKDRDECMELTSKNIKPNFWNQRGTPRFFNRSKKYYQGCLKERGYKFDYLN